MVSSKLFLLISSAILATAEKNCSQYGKSWRTFEQNCYLRYGSMPTTTDWYDAQNYCQQNGGHLLSVLSQKEDDFIMNSLGSGAEALWIGMNWATRESDEFIWSDGSNIEFAKINTSQLNPTDQKMCVFLIRFQDSWIKTPCSVKLNFICKRPLNREVVPVTPRLLVEGCESGWIHYKSKLDGTSKCFQFFAMENNQMVNWSNAYEACAYKPGPRHNLISIHTEEEQEFIASKLPETNVSFWIGMNRINFVDFGWTNNKKVNYYNWAQGEPTGVWQGCVEIINNNYRGGKWADTSCSAKQGYICQSFPESNSPIEPTDPPIVCHQDYTPYKTSCYKIQPAAEGAELTWHEAEKDCQKYGGHLASINNPQEQAFIYNYVIGMPSKSKSSKYWIGLNDNAHRGILEWVDGWPAYYADWAKKEPKLSSANPRCVFIDTQTKLWNTTKCEERQSHICKISKEKPSVVPETDKKMSCPNHLGLPWIDVGLKHCYFIKLGYETWGNAYLNCSFYGAHLASLHSDHEVALLSSYIKQANLGLWIGLQKQYHGDYRWKDGSKLDYENWNDLRIENIFEKERIKAGMCAEILSNDMTWMPNDCKQSSGFICKIEKEFY